MYEVPGSKEGFRQPFRLYRKTLGGTKEVRDAVNVARVQPEEDQLHPSGGTNQMDWLEPLFYKLASRGPVDLVKALKGWLL